MKNVNNSGRTLTFIVLLVFIGINAFSQTNSFYVYFIQNDKRINIKEEKVELKKEPFRIYMEYTEPVDILINSASKGTTYNYAQKGKLLNYIPGFSKEKKIESFFLNDNTINLTEEIPTVWSKNKTHGEKDLKTSDGRYICFRNIEKLYLIDKKRIFKIKDFKKDLYLVFIYAEKDKEGERMEIQREIVKIRWVEIYDEDTKAYKRKKKATDKEKIRAAERRLKRKQKFEKREKKALEKLEKKKKKKGEKKKKDKKTEDEKSE